MQYNKPRHAAGNESPPQDNTTGEASVLRVSQASGAVKQVVSDTTYTSDTSHLLTHANHDVSVCVTVLFPDHECCLCIKVCACVYACMCVRCLSCMYARVYVPLLLRAPRARCSPPWPVVSSPDADSAHVTHTLVTPPLLPLQPYILGIYQTTVC